MRLINKGSKSSLIGLVVTHMEFLGYRITQKEDGVFHAAHSSRFELQIIQGEAPEMGLLFGGKFVTTIQARQDRGGYMDFINSLNVSSNVTKFFRDPGDTEDLVFQAWYPDAYDKEAFSIFMDFIMEDVSAQFSMHKDTGKYLED